MKRTITIVILLLGASTGAVTFTEDFTSGVVDSVNWLVPLTADTLGTSFSTLTPDGLLQRIGAGDLATTEYDTRFKRELIGEFDVRLHVTLWIHTYEISLRGGLWFESCDRNHRTRLFTWSGTESLGPLTWRGSGHVFSRWSLAGGIEYITLDVWTGSFFDATYYNFSEETVEYRLVRTGDTFEAFRMGALGWNSMGSFTDAGWGDITELYIFTNHSAPDRPEARHRYKNFSAECDTIRFKTCCTPDTLSLGCVGDYLRLDGSGLFLPSVMFTVGSDSFYFDPATMSYDGVEFWWEIPEYVLSSGDTIEIHYGEASNANGCGIVLLDSIFRFPTPYQDIIDPVGREHIPIYDTLFESEFYITDTIGSGWLVPESTFIHYEGAQIPVTPDLTGLVTFIPAAGWTRGDTVMVILSSWASDGECIDHYVADTMWIYLAFVPLLDSLWFAEETDCNDSNIVEICFILSGDTADISVWMSADSGTTWMVPLATLMNIAGNLGLDIAPGTHCFQWVMNVDMPDSEGYNWMAMLEATMSGVPYDYDTALAPLDSRPPNIALSCPTMITSGESYSFEWLVSDLFRDDDPCSLHFFGCGIDEYYAISDTFFEWTPLSGCASCTLVIAARDSFCNWGYDTCTFAIEAPCTVSIDSVWFSEETDCDDRNIVEICYILSSTCPESTYSISAQMSGDGGTTWDVPLDSIWDDAGDIGDGVMIGTHCFNWEMGYDLPDSEGCEFTAMITVSSPIYVTDMTNERIVRINDMTGSGWIAYGDTGSGVGEFNAPRGIALGPDGKIYMIDSHNDRIIRINDMTGAGWIEYGSHGFGVGQFYLPFGITFGPHGRIYVADRDNNRIVRIDDMTGVGWVDYGSYGSGIGQFYFPSGIAVDSVGRIYVAEIGNERIVRIDSMNGAGWISYGDSGSGIGQFQKPRDIGIGPDGKIYIVDSQNYRIVRIDSMDGAGWITYGDTGSGIEEFQLPYNIAIRNDGKIYIVDRGNSRIVRIDDITGAGWITYGSYGTGIGEFWNAQGIAVAYEATPYAESNIGCLDSRPPDVTITCPTIRLYAGEEYTFEWLIDDLFWSHDPGTLFIDYDWGADTIIAGDTFYTWTIQPSCDSIRIRVAVRDSFCNWGYDSCAFAVCNPMQAWFECAPCGGFSSCSTQTVSLIISDTLCGEGLDNVFFTIKIYHEPGDSAICHYDGFSSEVSYFPIGDSIRVLIEDIPFIDCDSVFITLDSLLNDAGCLTIPEE